MKRVKKKLANKTAKLLLYAQDSVGELQTTLNGLESLNHDTFSYENESIKFPDTNFLAIINTEQVSSHNVVYMNKRTTLHFFCFGKTNIISIV